MLLVETSFRKIYESSSLAHDVIAELAKLDYRIYDICSYAQRSGDGELAPSRPNFCKDRLAHLPA